MHGWSRKRERQKDPSISNYIYPKQVNILVIEENRKEKRETKGSQYLQLIIYNQIEFMIWVPINSTGKIFYG